jgi:histone chaperone ASF1
MGDADMGDGDAMAKDDDAASDAGSEDLEAESSGSDDEDDEGDEGAEEADEDMEMGEGHAGATATHAETEVMAH